MKVTLNNGTELEAVGVHGGKRLIQGADRDVLTFLFAENVAVADLAAEFVEANCETILIGEHVEDENHNVISEAYGYNDYTIQLAVGNGIMAEIVPGGDDKVRYSYVKMAQKIESEKLADELLVMLLEEDLEEDEEV